jgi:hypothetical protein
MIIGAAIENNNLLLVAYSGRNIETQFSSFPLAENGGSDSEAKTVWDRAGDEARQILSQAEQVVFAMPSETCYLRRIVVKSRIIQEKPDYLKWIAGTYLPGNLDIYFHDFIPLRQSFDGTTTELLLFAMDSKKQINLTSMLNPGDGRLVKFLPEQLGLVQVLEMSLKKEEFPQAGIINCRQDSIAAVFARDGRFDHSRLFAYGLAHKSEITSDIETYFLSRADVTEQLPLVITGTTGCFATNWSPVIPAFMGIHNLEYAGAWGVADFVLRSSTVPGQG